MKICHLITSLGTGGAEIMLLELLGKMDSTRFESIVVSLMDRGTLAERIEFLGVPVHSLRMKAGRPTFQGIRRLRRLIREIKPDLIQGWMYHANLAALAAGRVLGRDVPVLWNIRHSLYDLALEKRLTAFVIRLGAWLSTRPKQIIYNSRVSSEQHESLGYNRIRRFIIPNGFDCEQFKPHTEMGQLLRKELKFGVKNIVIGMIARYHPMKDHMNFIQAAGNLSNRYSDIGFVMVGRGVDDKNVALQEAAREAGIINRVRFLGEQNNISAIINGLQIATSSSSWGEGFPNAIGEAMACGVPCVVTDIGDSAMIVGDTGFVVPPNDPQNLMKAWSRLIELGPQKRLGLGQAARMRIINNFSIQEVVDQYEKLYEEFASNRRN